MVVTPPVPAPVAEPEPVVETEPVVEQVGTVAEVVAEPDVETPEVAPTPPPAAARPPARGARFKSSPVPAAVPEVPADEDLTAAEPAVETDDDTALDAIDAQLADLDSQLAELDEAAADASVEVPEVPEAPDADENDADEDDEADVEATAVIALETPTKKRGRGLSKAASDVATVPESRRAQAHAKREARAAQQKSKAEQAALRARERGQSDRGGPAEKVVSKLPTMKPAFAALFTGVVSGLICVALTWGEIATCEAIRGNNECGDGFGLLAVVVVLAIEIVVGANLLKAFKVADPFSTSFLGVGLVAMVVMLTFMGDDNMASPAMIAIIPALTAVAFLLSWWVTVKFIEEPADR